MNIVEGAADHTVSRRIIRRRGTRLGRLAVMLAALACILYVDVAGTPGSATAFPLFVHHPFMLLFPYAVLIVWIGTWWESVIALGASWIGAYLVMSFISRWYNYGGGTANAVDWLVYLVTSLALLGLVARLRVSLPAGASRTPPSMTMDGDAASIDQERTRRMQGGGYVFGAARGEYPVEDQAPVRGL